MADQMAPANPSEQPGEKTNTTWIVLGILVVLAIIAFFLFRGSDEAVVEESESGVMVGEEEMMEEPMEEAMEADEAAAPAVDGDVKEFTVTGDPFAFSLSEMRVNQGDTVRVTFMNTEGMHDWRVDEFNAATNVIEAGEQETIEFVADQAGQFEYYCSVGEHRQLGMKGMLIVE